MPRRLRSSTDRSRKRARALNRNENRSYPDVDWATTTHPSQQATCFCNNMRTIYLRALSAICLLLLAGCAPPAEPVATFMPMARAIDLVNRNSQQIDGRLYGSGRWSARLTFEDGSRKNVDGSFRLHYAAPDRLCFQARGLGGNYFEAGCNSDDCWFWLQVDQDRMTIGSRQAMADAAHDNSLLIEPASLADVLGAQLLDPETAGMHGARYRVTGDHHQLVYEDVLDDGQTFITKEYWLSRFEPFLIERVIYRNTDGRVSMDAHLDRYKALTDGGPTIARTIEVDWPINECSLKLEFNRLQLHADVERIEFVRPDEREGVDPRYKPPTETLEIE